MIADISVIASYFAQPAGVQLISTPSETFTSTTLGWFSIITRYFADPAWLRELAPCLTDLVVLNLAGFLIVGAVFATVLVVNSV